MSDGPKKEQHACLGGSDGFDGVSGPLRDAGGLALGRPRLSGGEALASLIRHGLRCTSTAQALRREFPGTVHTERDLCCIERQEGKPLASAKLGTRPDGGLRLHRPDLAVVTEAGVIAVEVELACEARVRHQFGWKPARPDSTRALPSQAALVTLLALRQRVQT